MKNIVLLCIGLLITLGTVGQIKKLRPIQGQNRQSQSLQQHPNQQQDQQQTVIDNRPKPPVSDYKIISLSGDTTHVDTTLTIQKGYVFNYLRKDNFALLPFSNVGQSYTILSYNFNKVSLMPKFGARAAHFAYLEADDIHYYHVPTPWTELFFKTTFNQGQLLDAFFTSNISPQLNLFIGYKGLHSLGKYRHIMTSQGSFRAGLSYDSKNGRYGLKTHFISQRLNAQQNDGLTDLANRQYRSGSAQFNDRSVLDVKYEDAENLVRAKRFFVNHHYNMVQGNDSTANNQIRIGHRFNFTDQDYYYNQDRAFPLFGAAYIQNDIRDLVKFQEMTNTLFLQYQNKALGKFAFKGQQSHYNYGYHRKLYLADEVIPNRLKGEVYALGASYQNKIGDFFLAGDAMLNVAGDFDGNYLKAKAGYVVDSANRIEARLQINSRQPNYNFQLFQSAYKNYNWYHHFDNVQRQSIDFRLQSTKLLDLEANYTRLHNYAYFGLQNNPVSQARADTLVRPLQYDGDISYIKVKAHRQFNYGRFSLDNTLLYQEVLDGKSVFRVPRLITRNSLYYKDYWFQHHLYVQTGFTYHYFTSFKADAYDPILSEFYVQNFDELKGFSRLDFFFNAKVKTFRLFFKLENLTTIFAKNEQYAAPYQPYRDFVIRFGLIWDFFL